MVRLTFGRQKAEKFEHNCVTEVVLRVVFFFLIRRSGPLKICLEPQIQERRGPRDTS